MNNISSDSFSVEEAWCLVVFSELFFEFSSLNLVEASFLSLAFCWEFCTWLFRLWWELFSRNRIWRRKSTVSNTGFSAALANVLVEAKNTSSFSSSDNRREWSNREEEIDSSDSLCVYSFLLSLSFPPHEYVAMLFWKLNVAACCWKFFLWLDPQWKNFCCLKANDKLKSQWTLWILIGCKFL